MNFMDADICIEISRESQDALDWLASIPEELGIPGFVAMELIIGSQSRTELRSPKVSQGFPHRLGK